MNKLLQANDEATLVIIINYNNYQDSRDCILSCIESSIDMNDILVVDNHSDAAIIDRLILEFPQCHFLKLEENLGYSGAANLGFKAALERGYYYSLLLNNDILVNGETLPQLLQVFRDFTNVGLAGPVNLRTDGSILFSGGQVDFSNGVAIHYSQRLSEAVSTDFITGSAVLVKNEIFCRTDFFDESYFFYFEDVDFSCRVRLEGFQCVVTPHSTVIHKEGKTAKRNTFTFYYYQRNRLMLTQKTQNKRVLVLLLFHVIKELIFFAKLAICSDRSEIQKFWYTFYAILDFIVGKQGRQDKRHRIREDIIADRNS